MCAFPPSELLENPNFVRREFLAAPSHAASPRARGQDANQPQERVAAETAGQPRSFFLAVRPDRQQLLVR
jgi:hypothetical protein